MGQIPQQVWASMPSSKYESFQSSTVGFQGLHADQDEQESEQMTEETQCLPGYDGGWATPEGPEEVLASV